MQQKIVALLDTSATLREFKICHLAIIVYCFEQMACGTSAFSTHICMKNPIKLSVEQQSFPENRASSEDLLYLQSESS